MTRRADASTLAGGSLMSKMPDAGEDHGDFMFIASRDRILIADRPAGLDKRRHPRRMRHRYTVVEREEGIARQYGPLQIEIELPGLRNRLPHGIDPAGLTTPLAD